MELIRPMEPEKTDIIPEGDEWIYQVKWDGVRVLTYVGNGIRLFNRKQNERTRHYPEIVRFAEGLKHSVILDGEVIALVDGLPSFHEVLKRDLLRSPDKVKKRQKQVPIFYMIFDIVFWKDQWIDRMPLMDRIDLLHSVVQPEEHVQLVDFQEDGHALFDVIKNRGIEGIVAKRRDSHYLIGQKKEWQKIKNYQDLIGVIGGFTLSGGVVNAILLGLYDSQGFRYIGHTGTGKLTHAEWRHLTEILRPLVVKERPFYNRPGRDNNVYWVKPQLTVKIKYIQWTEGHSLRQPTIEGFVQVPPTECRM